MSFLNEFKLSLPVPSSMDQNRGDWVALKDDEKLAKSLIMAPMAGVSFLPFRTLNRRYGCGFAFTEMIDVRSLAYNNKRTKEMISTNPLDKPLGIQIVGNDPYDIVKGLEVLGNIKFDILDFNAACPKNKVTIKGQGASLLKNPKKLANLLKITVKHSPCKVTVKMRLGWDTISKASDIALYAEDTGVSAIIVHGRTRAQDYHGKVNYPAIKKIKERVKIPVIASGNILNPILAKKMFDETGCDGIMVARGAIGNPWIFKGIYELIKNSKIIKQPDINTVADTMKEHFNLYLDFFGENLSIIKFRKIYMWYTRSFSNVRPLRNKINNAKQPEDMINLIEEFRSMDKKRKLLCLNY